MNTNGYDYIEPGNYNESYLWIKLTGAAGMLGGRMPRGRTLPQSQIDQFAAYILSLD